MKSAAQSKITAIVLAGGLARRMGQLGTILPKALLAVPPGHTLLTRNIEFLLRSGIKKIVISVLPIQEGIFSAFLENFTATALFSGINDWEIKLFPNVHHENGPIPALGAAIDAFPSELYMLCLSDIFFFQEPFAFFDPSRLGGSTKILVGPRLAGRGGVIAVEGDAVSRISYIPSGEGSYNWAGAALFGRDAARSIAMFAKKARDEPLEDAFSIPTILHAGIEVVDVGDFINVNSFIDLSGCFLADKLPN